jgi:hypothetical protein
MKASALSSTSALEALGEAAERPAAIASSARAILSAVSWSDGGDGRFVAVLGDFPDTGLEALREPGFRGFFDMS